jgi:saccharopine dehydrogenase-like NADP-dependent oxidoreductase
VKILVLGGGAQGRVIAADLARALPDGRVAVADLERPSLGGLPNLEWIEADLAREGALERLMAEHDLAVGALPSRLGLRTMRAAIASRTNLVDVSFSAEDPLPLDRDARRAGVTIVPDCGLAPGLSHLLVGRAVARHGTPRRVDIEVGGVSEDPGAPYGYVVTWSLADLVEEYTRPARIVRDGAPAEVPALSGIERVTIEGVGEMESFWSDGLRTLLETLPGVRDMGERTLRWPGHVEAIRPLLARETLETEFRSRCSADPPRDLVALRVRVAWDGRRHEVVMTDRYDAASGLTAMARTTALTTAAVARLAALSGLGEPGVRPLEMLARDEAASRFVLAAVAERGIRFSERE